MVTIADHVRTAQTAATIAQLDIGAGNPTLVIGTDTSMTTVLLTFTLDGTNAYTPTTAGLAVVTGLPISTTAAASGLAGAYEYRDGNGLVCWSGTNITSSGGGGEVELASTTVVAGNNNDLVNASYLSPVS